MAVFGSPGPGSFTHAAMTLLEATFKSAVSAIESFTFRLPIVCVHGISCSLGITHTR